MVAPVFVSICMIRGDILQTFLWMYLVLRGLYSKDSTRRWERQEGLHCRNHTLVSNTAETTDRS